jgi:GDPmannose 4,6-dehydratase
VREFAEMAFAEVGINISWEGEGIEEIGVDNKTGKVLIEVDPYYFRPSEVDYLIGDSSKAQKKLGWNPRTTSFEELVTLMVRHDMKLYEAGQK